MITVTILTKNSERYLERVLDSLKGFPEVLILDTGSSDQTLTIAKKFSNVRVYERAFQGFGPTHNIASSLATNDWILSLDSDEIMTESLVHEVLNLALDRGCVYSFWRKNYYHGKHIRGCGWFPDRVVRLYHRSATRFSDALVHESVRTTDMSLVALSSPVLHFPYDSVSSFLRKMNTYTDLYAEQHVEKKTSLFSAVGHALFAFIKAFVFQKGFLLGREGFEIAWFNMNCAMYKYLKILEKKDFS